VAVGQPGPGVGILRVEIDGPFEKAPRRRIVLTGVACKQRPAPQQTIPGGHDGRPARDAALQFAELHFGHDQGRDLAGDLVLHRKDVGEHPIVTLSPDLVSRVSIDTARRDADHPIRLAHRALQHEPCTQFATDAPVISAAAPVRGAGAPGDDREQTPGGERNDQVLGEPIAEIDLRRIWAQVLER
jgi:hypothetical protein